MLHPATFCPACGTKLPRARDDRDGLREGERVNVLGERVAIDRDDLARLADGYRFRTRWTRSRRPRIAGNMLIGTAFCLVAVALGSYAAGLAAEAGGFILVAGIAFIIYLMLPPEQHHARVMVPWLRFHAWMDEHTSPIAVGVDRARSVRRERALLQAMKDERTRRINALGELFYRALRSDGYQDQIAGAADRVRRIEMQMLDQERRLDAIERAEHPAGDGGTPRAAPEAPGGTGTAAAMRDGEPVAEQGPSQASSAP